ncbi:hypothetical protein L210DRAFT_865949, partial [Boletus edulis BED1]
MCYISICLRRAQSSQTRVRLYPKSELLLDYVLDDALDHFGYLGSTFKLALDDIAVLAEDIQQHSWIWDNVCIPGRWDTWEINIKPHWPAAIHDLLLYILVAFAPNAFMDAFFRRTALKPKEGTNPLVYAAQFSKDEHARTLLSRGARLNRRGWEAVGYCQSLPIEVAFRNWDFAMVNLFVEEGCTVPSHIFTEPIPARESGFPPFLSFTARLLLQVDDFAE